MPPTRWQSRCATRMRPGRSSGWTWPGPWAKKWPARQMTRVRSYRGAPFQISTTLHCESVKTSFPECVEIRVNQQGVGTADLRQLDEEANPQPFEIGAPLAQRIFGLAGKLHNFQGVDLEVHRRLANLGEKTFTYQAGAETHETKFNYTLDESATQLVNIFEGLARQSTDLSDLVRTMRYDRLGVNDVLQTISADFDHKLLPEPERLLPALDQIGADEKFIDIARQKARALATRIRSTH